MHICYNRNRTTVTLCGYTVMGMFNRVETVALTELTLSQLMTLERNGLVIPDRESGVDASGATILYTWPQIVELRAIKRLRQTCSYPTLKQAVTVLDDLTCGNIDFSDKRLIAYGNAIYWIANDPDTFQTTITQLTGKNPGQGLITFTYFELLEDIKARSGQVIDFQSRARVPVAVAV